MNEKKNGTLKTGSGKKVTSNKQAIAIGLADSKKGGAKVTMKPASKPASPAGRKVTSKK